MRHISTVLLTLLIGLPYLVWSQSDLMADLRPGPDGFVNIKWVEPFQDRWVFFDENPDQDCRLGITDGTEAGTYWLACRPEWDNVTYLMSLEERVLFETYDNGEDITQVWSSDGSPDGLMKVWEDSIGQERRWRKVARSADPNQGYAVATNYLNNFTWDHQVDLIRTDGTPQGTHLLKSVAVPGNHDVQDLKIDRLDTRSLFTITHSLDTNNLGTVSHLQYWLTSSADDSATFLRKDQSNTTYAYSDQRSDHWLIGDRVFWLIPGYIIHSPLSELTDTTLIPVLDDNGQFSDIIQAFDAIPFADHLAFLTWHDQSKRSIWYEVDSAGITQYFSIPNWNSTLDPWVEVEGRRLGLLSNSFVNTQNPATHRLVSYDMATRQMDTLLDIQDHDLYYRATPGQGGLLLFYNEMGERVLYQSDGTQAGTRQIHIQAQDLISGMPNPCINDAIILSVLNDTLYWSAKGSGLGHELGQVNLASGLWRWMADDYVGSGSSEPRWLRATENELIYISTDLEHGREWRKIAYQAAATPPPPLSYDQHRWHELVTDAPLIDLDINASGHTLLTTGRSGYQAINFLEQGYEQAVPLDTVFRPDLEGVIGMFWVSQFAPNGQLRWARALPVHSLNGLNQQSALAPDLSSYIILSGWAWDSYTYPFTDQIDNFSFNPEPGATIIKLDSSGQAEWMQEVQGGTSVFFGNNFATSQAEANAQGLYLRGRAYAPLQTSLGNYQIDVPRVNQFYDPSHYQFSDPGLPAHILLHLGVDGQADWHYVANSHQLINFALSPSGDRIALLDSVQIKILDAMTGTVQASAELPWAIRQEVDSGLLLLRTTTLALDDQGHVWLSFFNMDENEVSYGLITRLDPSLKAEMIFKIPVQEGCLFCYSGEQTVQVDGAGGCYWWLKGESVYHFDQNLSITHSQSFLSEAPDRWAVSQAHLTFASVPGQQMIAALGGDLQEGCVESNVTTGLIVLDSSQLPIYQGSQPELFSDNPNLPTPGPLQTGQWQFGPIPTDRYLYTIALPIEETPWQHRLYDLSGRVLLSGQQETSVRTLDLGKLTTGVYFLEVQQGDAVEVLKVVKRGQ